MCHKCQEIDEKVEHYRRLAKQITDQQFNERTMALITELEAEKAALHPEQE